MKILVFNWQDIRNPLGGGAEVHLHEIFKRLAQRGHEVTLYCSRFRGSEAGETIDGIRVVRGGGRNFFNYSVPFRYRKEFAGERYDVIVDDINKIPFYTPLFVKEPVVGILHHLFGTSIFSEAPFPAALYVLASEWMALRIYRNTRIAVVSESTKQELISHGFRRDLLHIVPNCVDHQVYQSVLRAGQGNVIGYLGRLKKYKSVEHLLSAFAIVLKETPDARLVIVGEGDARKGLELFARDLRIAQSVEFTGYVTQETKVGYLNRMKFAVNTSAKEGWGLTVIEANACGVPLIASDVSGLRDSVLHEKTGLLYDYGDIEQLAEKMLLLLRDEHLRSRLSREALEWAGTFHWDRSADAMLDVLTGAADGGHNA